MAYHVNSFKNLSKELIYADDYGFVLFLFAIENQSFLRLGLQIEYFCWQLCLYYCYGTCKSNNACLVF